MLLSLLLGGCQQLRKLLLIELQGVMDPTEGAESIIKTWFMTSLCELLSNGSQARSLLAKQNSCVADAAAHSSLFASFDLPVVGLWTSKHPF